jgi:gliding motility-associated-like protein
VPVSNFTFSSPKCVGQAITFTNAATIASGSIVKWTWTFGDATPAIVALTGANQSHSYTTAGTYTVTLLVESNNGCTHSVSKTVTVYQTTANFTINATPTCIGTGVSFTDASAGAGSAINNWQWNFGNTQTSTSQNPTGITYSSAGTFNVSLQATSAEGCIGTVIKTVTVSGVLAAPVINCTDSTFTSVTFGWTAITGATGYQVSVDGGTTWIVPSSGATGTTHIVTGLPANTSKCISVRANAALACQTSPVATSCCKTLLPNLEVYIPNTFTPNGDGQNDLLKVYSNYIKTMSMKVFNQWGELIFATTDPTKGWDGTGKGKLQPVGVYIYVVQVVLQDGNIINKKGSVNLIR